MSALMNMLQEMRTSLEKNVANIQGTVVELEEKLKRHQDEAAVELKCGQELVMTSLEEQMQAVSQVLENQDQRISAVEEQLQQVKDLVKEMVREELRELCSLERSLATVAPAFLDRCSGVVAKLCS
nr:unnamed protein product [Callosobruchus chinensis]CAH7755689.1 unnamed protein product [Callosobruchus chinensis]